jgi:winged helix-turn helix protein
VLSRLTEAVVTRHSPFVIELSAQDRAALEQRARTYTAPYHQVMRAKIVLLAADGLENTVIAGRLDVAVQLVSKWRKRFYEEGTPGLEDRPRSGRPRVFPPCGRGERQGAGL